ncbi:hypothetical protein A8F94_14235 [Bacillus sp. FJAT-27225]|uniref:nuclease-related domain-containing protein n=1 Tax=Bacillus sp. FJAT-27225 TaxID=1743144 RepID=UPI00080C2E69|nr:nuclease-related domain-containing protein [Bacillus sp. FJAT-27225]OCA86000.1 hypothetical protein A8F94_14235 [Bacillus sp. FJAT-27225]
MDNKILLEKLSQLKGIRLVKHPNSELINGECITRKRGRRKNVIGNINPNGTSFILYSKGKWTSKNELGIKSVEEAIIWLKKDIELLSHNRTDTAPKGTYSQTGVFKFDDYKDHLIIDRHHPDAQKKQKNISSEKSEDAMTWNVFKSIGQLDPQIWLPILFRQAFGTDILYENMKPSITLWKKLPPPPNTGIEGKTEVDIIIETPSFVWVIEAKYTSGRMAGNYENMATLLY